MLHSTSFAPHVPYIYSFTRTLGGGRRVEVSHDGRAIIYSDGSQFIVSDFAYAYNVLKQMSGAQNTL